jgi:hypothetical protein
MGVLGACLVVGCGSEEGDEGVGGGASMGQQMSGGGNTDKSKIVYPDSHCTDEGCEKGGCDPDSSDPNVPDCDAWQILGTFALQAVKISDQGTPGRPTLAARGDSDLCPVNSVTPKGKTEHCCERVETQVEKPGFKLTGISMMTPPVFGQQTVTTTNKTAIEEDRYNWIMELSSNEDGPVIIKSGLGLPNTDGSFYFAKGPFEAGGKTWNANGEWDPHDIPAVLSTNPDGSRRLAYPGQYVPKAMGRYFQMPIWGARYEYTMLELSMNGITMNIDVTEDLLCAGFLTGNTTFDQVGEMEAYLPLEPLRGVHLHFSADDQGSLSLCSLTAGITSDECKLPVAEWGE